MTQTHGEALDLFVAFTEAAGQITDLDDLAHLALETLRTLIPGANVAFTERTPTHWQLRQWTDNLAPDLLAMAQQRGFPLETPVFAELVGTGQPSFVDGWRAAEQAVAHTEQFQAVAHYPIVQGSEVVAAIGLAVTDQHVWTDRQKAIVRSVGRSFSLLYERVRVTDELRVQQKEAEARTQVLELLANLTAKLTTEADDEVLIQRAQTQVLALLPPSHAAYWEPKGKLWRLGAHVNDVGNAELMAMMRAGVPVGQIPTLDTPWETGEALWQDDYARDTDVDAELTQHVYAVASLPIGVGPGQRGVINFSTFEPHRWSAPERALLTTLARGLWLALDRTAALRRQRDEAQKRSQALEAFALLSRDLAAETDRYALIRRAQKIILSLLPPGSSVYWELEHHSWRPKTQVGEYDPVMQAYLEEHGLPEDAPGCAVPWRSGEPHYQDQYALGTDVSSDMHVPVDTTAMLPVRVQGQPVGLLGIGLFGVQPWTWLDRTVLETAVSSLNLMLDRAQGVAALAERTAELERTNAELQTSNEELEAFTYSASHDLRTPIRHIKGFGELALKALRDTPNPRVERHLGIVLSAADRMTALIDAMLVLSRAGQAELHVRPLALDLLVAQALRDAEIEFPHMTVDWQIGPLPTAPADPVTIQQVLTNLLSNAVKYAASERPLQVHLWAEERPGAWAIQVRDNGVGFDPLYAGKLFGVFQRLHLQEQFAGTGIGLATVRRIVTRHGGQVWAEGRPGEGATFGFTRPTGPSQVR
ncbi:GAF domain-containing sensor histidine kinase [Deinococcus humi]|uniref:histidine kinase n=1 Tax=Deinococcus humi TaxID=662880 RepID=A0A7W8JYX3_9DEIO|nr:ATP-binding protein [Deinococcus humi]MBB5365781.1 signal transduction histidine kinase [Deinococcus humi]GGO41068.1 hypothetical protein GCM10008949_51360 [Deinococcus humi]